MFKPFNQFTNDIFKSHSEKLRSIYKNETNHRTNYVAREGFSDWFESFRGENISKAEAKNVVITLQKYGDRTLEQAVTNLSYLIRNYDINLPVEGGILSKEFWEKELSLSSEMTL